MLKHQHVHCEPVLGKRKCPPDADDGEKLRKQDLLERVYWLKVHKTHIFPLFWVLVFKLTLNVY